MEYIGAAVIVLSMLGLAYIINLIDNSRENATQAVTNFVLSMIRKYDQKHDYQDASMHMIKNDFKHRMDYIIRILARWDKVSEKVKNQLRDDHD